jgi:hypothetical protein
MNFDGLSNNWRIVPMLATLLAGPLTAHAQPCACPVLIENPQSQTALTGETVSFTAVYADPTPSQPPLTSCQWVFNDGTNIPPGSQVLLTSNSCTLVITNVSASFAGVYTVMV